MDNFRRLEKMQGLYTLNSINGVSKTGTRVRGREKGMECQGFVGVACMEILIIEAEVASDMQGDFSDLVHKGLQKSFVGS